ncbi:MAG: TIGR04150 pseudo-rSAM protein [Tannerella sp.]|nr:TIGR04150 pseudo-rSAM protein [Tannerella sp.]
MLWFYLEPFVFISEDSKGFLFYNANSKRVILFDKNENINRVIKYLQNPVFMYSIKIGVKELENDHLYNLIKTLQEAGFGDIIEGDLSKPVLMQPILNLQKSVKHLKTDLHLQSDRLLSYLHEVTVFVNGSCKYRCKECRTMFKQLSCCTKSKDTLNYTLLDNFLHSISGIRSSINITGGDVFQYPELKKLFNLLEKRNSINTFTVNYRNIPEDSALLHLLSKESFRIKVIVNESYQEKSLETVAEKLYQENVNQLWEISVTSAAEYGKAELLGEKLSEHNIKINIKPFYNRKNLSFFEENIYIQPEDLIAVELDKQDIFALQELNTNNWGKITVMADGKVYANLNKDSIGDINEKIGDILCRELINGGSWRHTRYNTKTCNQCRFKLICPSPSNYESAIGKSNLCHVKL